MRALIIVVVACSLPMLASAQDKWVCSAEGLASGRYTGGSGANIHLSRYSSGGYYPVKKIDDSTAVGETQDGTKFTCKKIGQNPSKDPGTNQTTNPT